MTTRGSACKMKGLRVVVLSTVPVPGVQRSAPGVQRNVPGVQRNVAGVQRNAPGVQRNVSVHHGCTAL